MTGVILAGGKSSRMGRDKRSIILPGGLSMGEKSKRILTLSLCKDVVVSGPGGIEDIHPGKGPLAGIEASLHEVSGEFALFLPCDMPFVTPEQVSLLIQSSERIPYGNLLMDFDYPEDLPA